MKQKVLVLIALTALLMLLPVTSAVNAHLVNSNFPRMDGSGPAPPPMPGGFTLPDGSGPAPPPMPGGFAPDGSGPAPPPMPGGFAPAA